jgi:uncharacterized tellurite resistance protein B-like protein|tara:strand:+ start:272 stop:703 length:432 start_codon:yes stop_codon:yes gene_type:complete
MITKLFKKTKKDKEIIDSDSLTRITALLIHAAKIDDHYSQNEKEIIMDFLKSMDKKLDAENVLKQAEREEENSNQILKYTQETKKNTLEFRSIIIKVLWKIILSDDNIDAYESNLMRRICGLLYFPDKLSGEIRLEVLKGKNS